jgi:hypothetical protein
MLLNVSFQREVGTGSDGENMYLDCMYVLLRVHICVYYSEYIICTWSMYVLGFVLGVPARSM